MRGQIILIVFLIVVFLFSLFGKDKRPDEFPVISYRNLEVKELNLQIATAEKKKEEWAFSPLSIAMQFHKPSDVIRS